MGRALRVLGQEQHNHAMQIGQPWHFVPSVLDIGRDGSGVGEVLVVIMRYQDAPKASERWIANPAMTPSAEAKVTL
jgi:hypothetical protein